MCNGKASLVVVSGVLDMPCRNGLMYMSLAPDNPQLLQEQVVPGVARCGWDEDPCLLLLVHRRRMAGIMKSKYYSTIFDVLACCPCSALPVWNCAAYSGLMCKSMAAVPLFS